MKNLYKKLLIVCGVIAAVSLASSVVSPQIALADEGFHGTCRDFLGLTSWDCGVNITNENDLKANVWTIVANIITDITIIAAYLVLGYVIYGGYLYIFSSGEPGKVAAAKKTLYHAFLGLAIVLLANIIMGSIRIALVGGNGSMSNCVSGNCVGPTQMVDNLVHWVIGIAGIVSAIFVVYGGIAFMSSSGDPGKVKKAKDTITYALIGLIIVALAELISAFVTTIIHRASYESPNNDTFISKEVYETKIN